MKRTAENAPLDRPILVWVREATRDRRGAWRVGRAIGGDGMPTMLYADGLSGDWEIPTWTDFPPPPAGEK